MFGTANKRRLFAHAIIVLLFNFLNVVAVAKTEVLDLDKHIHHSDLGTLLNQPGKAQPKWIPETHEVLTSIVNQLNKNNPKKDQFHWVVEIRSSPDIFAAADLYDIKKNLPERKRVAAIHSIRDRKPIAVIQVSTGFLSLLKTASQLAFPIGHEITHHLEGHTVKSDGSPITELISRQSNEGVADKGSLNLMKGSFALNEAHPALTALLEASPHYQITAPKTLDQQLSAAKDALTEDHHHPGLRLAMLIEAENALLEKYPEARQVHDWDLPSFFKSLGTLYPGNMPNAAKSGLIDVLRTVRDQKTESVYDIQKKITLFLKKFPNFWAYVDSDEILLKTLKYLEQSQISPNNKAQLLTIMLMGANDWATGLESFFGRLNPNTKEKLTSALNGLSSPHFIDQVDLDHLNSVVWRSRDLGNLVHELSKQNPTWNTIVEKILTQSAPRGNVHITMGIPSVSVLDRQWDRLRFLKYLENLELLTPTEMSDFSRENNLLAIMAGLKNKKTYSVAKDLIGAGRIDKILEQLENKVQEKYELLRNDLMSNANKNTDSEMSFLQIWLKRAAIDPQKPFDQDLALFFKALLAEDLGRLDILTMYSKEFDWKSLLEKLFPKVLVDTSISNEEKLKILIQLTEMSGDQNLLESVTHNNPKFKANLIALYKAISDPMKSVFDAPMNPTVASIRSSIEYKMKVIEVFSRLGLTETYFASRAGKTQLYELIKTYESLLARIAKPDKPRESYDGRMPNDRFARILIEWALGQAKQMGINEAAFEIVTRTINVISSKYQITPEFLAETSRYIESHLKSFSGIEKINELKKVGVYRSLSSSDLARHLAEALIEAKKKRRSIEVQWKILSTEFDFSGKNRALAERIRQIVAERIQLQPIKVRQAMKIKSLSDTKRAEAFSSMVRVWSGIIELIHAQDFNGQMKAIDYFMGRTATLPEFLETLHVHNSGELGLRARAEELRSQLSAKNEYERSFFVNSILQGPGGQIMKAGHRTQLLNALTVSVDPSEREVAKDSIDSMLESENHRAGVLISQILSKPEITATTLMQTGLENYFVPGLKFAQYLAFTDQFKQYESVFVDTQDSVPVAGYYDLMDYIFRALNQKIDLSKIFILRVLGAGTVNMALEYIDLKTSETKVLHIPRELIKQKTMADFARFEKFAQRLAAKSRPGKDYQFVAGLVPLIRDSVQLEFDRKASFQRQNEAFEIYRDEKIQSWNLKSVEAHELIDDTILMDKGAGLTAKKIKQQNPKLYREIMSGLYQFEKNRIFKLVETADQKFIRLANPDLHDGQVLIDEKTKSVTVIDFGQALPISQLQINFGLDLIAMLTGVKAKSSSLALLNRWIVHSGSKLEFSKQELEALFEKQDPMDRFVRLISKLQIKNASLPLEVVHFILQLNRLVKLGQKVGGYPKLAMGYELLWRELKGRKNATLPDTNVTTCRSFYRH